jgi:carbonic anhydrase/acetyltransferase-like protein (isoleucine patch superfamily)
MDVAQSAVVLGEVQTDASSYLAQGAVIRSIDGAVAIGAGSFVLENGVVVGRASSPVRIGAKAVFGHRCLVIGAEVGDLCEIGNGTIILPGARLGTGVMTGEGALIPAGTEVPDNAVVVGRPARRIRFVNDADIARLTALRGGDLSIPTSHLQPFDGRRAQGAAMGTTYAFRDTWPTIDPTAVLLDSAEITGDVHVGARTIIGAGVKIIGDSHGPVRIGADVQILENTVLHLLPDNELVLGDGVIIGPGCMIHGCHIGAGTVVEPGANVCDWSVIGVECVVGAGAVVKQRSAFGDRVAIDGFPATEVSALTEAPSLPSWAFQAGDIEGLVPR